ncbi:MAG: 50S ribosomal protein L21 [Chloroherpetonaceae bacterium]|jgi:large subunit ribosomal protein L21|nr:50S ribosomal protein L21 [bacterium]HAW07949.1 50S ribosomal protein L21 [Bacteroidota bacterium]
MWAIVEISGNQYEVHPNQKMLVPKLNAEIGEDIEFDKILLYNDEQENRIGVPYIDGKVKAKVLGAYKDKKILIFHKIRRKGHRKLNGHRQNYTSIEITDIQVN